MKWDGLVFIAAQVGKEEVYKWDVFEIARPLPASRCVRSPIMDYFESKH